MTGVIGNWERENRQKNEETKYVFQRSHLIHIDATYFELLIPFLFILLFCFDLFFLVRFTLFTSHVDYYLHFMLKNSHFVNRFFIVIRFNALSYACIERLLMMKPIQESDENDGTAELWELNLNLNSILLPLHSRYSSTIRWLIRCFSTIIWFWWWLVSAPVPNSKITVHLLCTESVKETRECTRRIIEVNRDKTQFLNRNYSRFFIFEELSFHRKAWEFKV